MSIPVMRPTLRRKDLNGVLSCLVSDHIGPGQLSAELAGELARRLGTGGGLCLSSYAAAIECVLDLLEVAPGDSIVISALAPSIYQRVCARRGIHTLIVDVGEGSPLLDATALDRLLTSGHGGEDTPGPAHRGIEGSPAAGALPKAIVLHYTLGFVPESAVPLRVGIPLVEDVSHAVGGTYDGSPCGGHGELAVVALQPEGLITAGQGAAVFARDRKVARSLGSIGKGWDHDRLLPDMNAALGLSQLKELERFLRLRQEISEAYLQAIVRSRHGALTAGVGVSGQPGAAGQPEQVSASRQPALGVSTEVGETRAVAYAFPVVVKGGLKDVRQYAAKRGVETRRAFSDAVLAFEDGDGAAVSGLPQTFPRAYELLQRSLLFPLYPSLAKKDVQLIAKVLATLP